MSAPFFSIIIPCRNAAATLPAALASLAGQTERDFEVIVVDGVSTDGTAELLARAASPTLQVIREPDRGVYDAMNKGLARARGTWLLFLGADDRLADPAVLTNVRAALGSAAPGVFCGEAVYTDGRVWPAPTQPNVRYRNFLHHQACFYHRSLLAPGYDEAFPIQADYDLNLRLWHAGHRPTPLPVRVAVCGAGGLSDGGRWANYRDEIRVRHHHFAAWQCWLWDLGSLARYFRKKAVRSFASTRPE